MLPSICLTRHLLGVVTRIECRVCPLAGERGLWALLCVAGMDAMQPSLINAQGPFYGPCAAQEILAGIALSLQAQGYQRVADVPIWRVHMQAQIRRLNGCAGAAKRPLQFQPEA